MPPYILKLSLVLQWLHWESKTQRRAFGQKSLVSDVFLKDFFWHEEELQLKIGLNLKAIGGLKNAERLWVHLTLHSPLEDTWP